MTSLTRFSALALAAVGSLALVSCSAAAENNPGGATGDGDDALSIVTSTAIWADVAESVVDSEEVEVTAIVEGNDADPHSFEPTAADIARTAEADLIVVGGGGYDAWLYDSQEEDKIIHALPLTAHDHDHDHAAHEAEPAAEGGDHNEDDHSHGEIESIDGNEHIWYDTDAVTRVAEDIAERVREINPDVATDTTEITTAMDDIHSLLHTLPEIQVAQTEPIADYLLAHSDVADITPEGYRTASLSHSEPAAADLAEFLELIESGELDLLIYNPQTQTDLTERIRTAAEEADIPVVEVFETPEAGENFITFFEDAVNRLTEISLEIAGDQPDAAA